MRMSEKHYGTTRIHKNYRRERNAELMVRLMSTDRLTRETMSIEEATISSMWEIAAIVEVLEWKGILPKGK